ncbi:hypothetical protein IV203_013616 [Nitzschia inconspicua]|uniref:Uncharacterized protein n=1 Tax=Nitzschia inconspicua TaxID=303405 RepID=A0A9K3M918_9STRA|nr:hypothetical protein IV203_013616 [Nitzschia inconspicua]
MEQCHQKEPVGKAGFLEDINKKIQSDKESSETTAPTKASLEWIGKCRSLTVYTSERTMRMIPLAKEDSSLVTGKEHFALCTWTAHPFIAAQTGLINSENDTLIQQLHSKCISICMEADGSPSRQRALIGMTKNYLPFRKCLVTEPYTPAEHVLTDQSIKNQNHHKCHVARA